MKRIVESFSASQQTGKAEIRLPTGAKGWKFALIYFEATGDTTPGSGGQPTELVVRSSSSRANFTRADGSEVPIPALNTGVWTSLGPGCQLPYPLPSELVVSLTVLGAGGTGNVRVDLIRYEDDVLSRLADAVDSALSKIVKLLQSGKR